MMAAASDRIGTLHAGRNLPASSEASSAPRMIPTFMTDVTSARTLASRAAFCAGAVQYGHDATGMPIACAIFAPQRANADVTPHGRPARSSVAMLTTASPTAPAANGHGPRSQATDELPG